jgi:8-oxo-dGTP pyrophosphatase MutT (NUDIX family)
MPISWQAEVSAQLHVILGLTQMNSAGDWIRQAAAIPFREGAVCLVTSRGGKRWVIPKGCEEPGMTSGETALKEAWEEAGLVGTLEPEPAGSYFYEKSGNRYLVTVFLMHVTEAIPQWPEQNWRIRRWVAPQQAVAWIEQFGLQRILRKALATDPVFQATTA